MKTNADLTLYSYTITEAGVETWTRFEIPNVVWQDSYSQNKLRSGAVNADRVNVWIPINDRSFVLKEEDYIVKGIVEDVITSEFTISDLRQKYSNCMKITSVDVKDYAARKSMNHIRIMAA